MMGVRFLNRLGREQTATTLTEFGFVGPVLIVMLVGLFDVAHTQYTGAMVNGAMQKAGRDISLESAGSTEAQIDARVISQVTTVTPNNATVTLEKLSHFDFSDIGEEEPYTDENGDKVCNDNEPYEDTNDNGQWDANRGKAGFGGARDAVLYTATVTYPRLFPIDKFVPGMAANVRVRASTVLRNQPYDEQSTQVSVGNCT
ncbi:MAG: TadE/TadG family type IV pilus assembly protein [Pseudomonadota bacterium]